MQTNMKKILPIFTIVLIVVGGGAFYGGMEYSISKNSSVSVSRGNGNMFRGARGGAGVRAGSEFVSGEIIAKDDKSLTVKLRDGGSKIVFFSTSTDVGESVSGNIDDLKVGGNITVNGEANPDGSITGRMIQIRTQNLQKILDK